MRRHWFTAALILGLALGAASRVDAAVQTGCDANGEFIVDNVVNPASSIAEGYLNKNCNLIIKVTVTPTVVNWKANAKSISILGTGTPDQLTLINTLANSKVQLLAANGNVFIENATVKARDLVNLDCSGAACRVDIDDSIIIASPSLDVFNIPGDPSSGFSTKGDININTVGDIDIQRSTVWGGAGIHWNSKQGKITWFCPAGGSVGCKDPNDPPFPAILVAQCPDPADPTKFILPCTVTFNNAAELRSVCFPGTGGNVCGGGQTEVRLTAFLDIDISGSTFVFLNHVTFESVTGSFLAANSNITAKDNVIIEVKKTIDVSNATWSSTNGNILLQSGSGCVTADPGFCIDARFADFSTGGNLTFIANKGNGDIILCGGTFDQGASGFPKFNGPKPYPASVIQDAAQCAANGGLPPATILGP